MIDYQEIISKYPWLLERDHNCIISPDADGMICGLFMSNYLGWKVVGYYDNGKNLLLKKGIAAKDCIFLDTEIFRKDIRSCGHHIILYRNNELPPNWSNFENCLNPNNLRGRSHEDQFGLKYPMGTIHLLLNIISNVHRISFTEDALFAVMQADGTINRFIDRYTKNLLDWLQYLGVDETGNVLHGLLFTKIELIKLSREYVNYVERFVINKKDKIPISSPTGLVSTSFNNSGDGFSQQCIERVHEYLRFISRSTGWMFNQTLWTWNDFRIFRFTKKTCRPGVKTFNQAAADNFLSLAITDTITMEYTLEEPDKLP